MNVLLKMLRESFLWLLLLPASMYFMGTASNQLVLIANHDKFPVMVNAVKLADFENSADGSLPDGMLDNVHCVMTSETHLNALADIFDLNSSGTYSIGDFLLVAGEESRDYIFFVWLALVVYKQNLQQK
jgi:hypothetical protein